MLALVTMNRQTRLSGLAPRGITGCLVLLSLQFVASAHDVFTAFVQHAVRLEVGANSIDLTVTLTFFEEWSARERRAMDTDNDGSISRIEIDSYIKLLTPEFSKSLRLQMGDRALDLVPLYKPEVDLLSNAKTGPGHHRLRLFFFAPSPRDLGAPSDFIVEDGLWPGAKAITTLEAAGTDGCLLAAEKPGGPAPALAPGETRRLKVRCVKPPHAP